MVIDDTDSCTVVNKYKSAYDVYIGRGSIFGNPFVIGRDGTRDEVIAKFREQFARLILEGWIPLSELRKLKGKKLGCFCHPKACHGDIIAKVVNRL